MGMKKRNNENNIMYGNETIVSASKTSYYLSPWATWACWCLRSMFVCLFHFVSYFFMFVCLRRLCAHTCERARPLHLFNCEFRGYFDNLFLFHRAPAPLFALCWFGGIPAFFIFHNSWTLHTDDQDFTCKTPCSISRSLSPSQRSNTMRNANRLNVH